MEKGANIEQTVTAKWVYGFTVLTISACKGHMGVVKCLLNNDADPLVVDGLDRSVVSLAKKNEHRAIYLLLKEEAYKRRKQMAKGLWPKKKEKEQVPWVAERHLSHPS